MDISKLISYLRSHAATLLIAGIWLAMYIADRAAGLLPLLAGKGVGLVGREYYRYVTGPLMHFDLPHLLVNVSTMLVVGHFLEPRVGALRLFLFGLAAGTLAELIYACIFRSSENNIGGSVWIFAFIGWIIVYQIWRPDFPRLRLGTWCGSWIAAYAVLGNIPLLPFMDAGTVWTHLIALLTGGLMGLGTLHWPISA